MWLSKTFLGRRDPRLVVRSPVVDRKRHHAIISGTARAGTTFLIKLLTNLGLETGYHGDSMREFANCHAGLEKDLRDEDAP
jgi:hypothetical protein